MRKQCTVVNLIERPEGMMEAYFRFNYGADENVLPDDCKAKYWQDTWITWKFNPADESSWVLPLVISCWKKESPITCIFDKTGSIMAVSLDFVPINYTEE